MGVDKIQEFIEKRDLKNGKTYIIASDYEYLELIREFGRDIVEKELEKY